MFQSGVFIWQWRPLWSWWAGGGHEAEGGRVGGVMLLLWRKGREQPDPSASFVA